MPLVQILFDFLKDCVQAPAPPAPRRSFGAVRVPPPVPARATVPRSTRLVRPRAPRGIDHGRPCQRRYDRVVDSMLEEHRIHVRRWRNSLSGLATLRTYRDGREERWLESPYPTSPLRLAIFLHEVGHHVLGLGVHRPRCLEEYLAWRYAIDRMDELGFPTEGAVARRFERSMRHAVAKAVRRGIRALPPELAAFAAAA